MEYIHNESYQHNDFKSNNVIMHRWGSKGILKVEGYKRHAASYLTPEVILGKKESPVSDMYSFRKTVEAAVSGPSFCHSLEKISDMTTLAASGRAFR